MAAFGNFQKGDTFGFWDMKWIMDIREFCRIYFDHYLFLILLYLQMFKLWQLTTLFNCALQRNHFEDPCQQTSKEQDMKINEVSRMWRFNLFVFQVPASSSSMSPACIRRSKYFRKIYIKIIKLQTCENFFMFPRQKNNMSPFQKGPFQKQNSSSNHHCSGETR